jgi:hypothetical protein
MEPAHADIQPAETAARSAANLFTKRLKTILLDAPWALTSVSLNTPAYHKVLQYCGTQKAASHDFLSQ